MLCVRTVSQEFYTRTSALYRLIKDETTNFDTGALYVLVGPMLHVAAVTLLNMKLVTTVVNQNKLKLPNRLKLRLYVCPIQ